MCNSVLVAQASREFERALIGKLIAYKRLGKSYSVRVLNAISCGAIKTRWAAFRGSREQAWFMIHASLHLHSGSRVKQSGQLTVFGGETRLSNFSGCERATVGDVATTAANSVPFSRCLDESKGFLFFVLIFSQMMTCFISASGENFREQTGHKSRRTFAGGISMNISFSC